MYTGKQFHGTDLHIDNVQLLTKVLYTKCNAASIYLSSCSF